MSTNTQVKYLRYIEWILFFGLCFLSTYFTWGVFVKFFDGQTSFSQYEVPITEIPTVTFCFIKTDMPQTKYEYGTDFRIEYLYEGGLKPHISIFLAKGDNSNALEETVNVQKLITFLMGYCYKISVANPSVTHSRGFYIHFNESINEKDLPSIKVYVTSEENAYGVVMNKWRNGKLATTEINKYMANSVSLKQENYEYLSANGKCSQETFYECLGRLQAIRLGDAKCSIFSFPSLPICKNNETYYASYMALKDVLPKVESLSAFKNGLCPKLCTTVDYNGELAVSGPVKLLPYNPSATYVFEYKFKHSSVIVYKEYIIYDAISMIGSVGGTLGMCIGFSFTGLVACVINLIHRVFYEN